MSAKPLKIAMMIDAWFPVYGGGQVHVQKIAEQLIKNHNVEIDLFVRALKDDKGQKFKENNVYLDGKFRVFRIGPCTKFFNLRGRLMWLWRVVPVVLKAHRKNKYDLIHAQAFLSAIPAKIIKFFTRLPLVYSVHGTSLFHKKRGLQARIERRLLCRLKYDREISVAYNFRNLKNVNKNIAVIPNGVDLELFTKIETLRPNTPFTLIFVGRLDPIKGLHHLIEALKNWDFEKAPLELKIVGSGPDKKRLQTLIKKLKLEEVITFTGKLKKNDLISEYKSAHIFVLPSLSEGQPLTILEAGAASLPVIATDVGDNARIIRSGQNGWLVKPGKPEELEIALQKAHKLFQEKPHKFEALGQYAFNVIKSKYTWTKTAQETYAVYQELLK
ncbi:glycosyltransferase family 4 protein [Candidatus Peregrinibacteria bacterium]|jgi:glycosyltransferase involved in cell wall biosynthesis|nr:glycosyltransferase family 4 protein [Candidatus Peregrinibacteria bacterium]